MHRDMNIDYGGYRSEALPPRKQTRVRLYAKARPTEAKQRMKYPRKKWPLAMFKRSQSKLNNVQWRGVPLFVVTFTFAAPPLSFIAHGAETLLPDISRDLGSNITRGEIFPLFRESLSRTENSCATNVRRYGKGEKGAAVLFLGRNYQSSQLRDYGMKSFRGTLRVR